MNSFDVFVIKGFTVVNGKDFVTLVNRIVAAKPIYNHTILGFKFFMTSFLPFPHGALSNLILFPSILIIGMLMYVYILR